MTSRYPTTTSELPDTEFWAILTPEATTIPGDERSRTNPGHGYPEHTTYSWHMQVFTNAEAWRAEVERLASSRYGKDFRAVKITPAKLVSKVVIEWADEQEP